MRINGYDEAERGEILKEALYDLRAARDSMNAAGHDLAGELDRIIKRVEADRTALVDAAVLGAGAGQTTCEEAP